jgi:hypothetical protein
MKRGSFLKLFGIGVVAAVTSPTKFMNLENTKFINSDSLKEKPKESFKNIGFADYGVSSALPHTLATCRSETLIEMQKDVGNYYKILKDIK